MAVLSGETFQRTRAGPGDGELIALSRPLVRQPRLGDEVELEGQCYRVVLQLWACTGVMGAIVLLKRLVP